MKLRDLINESEWGTPITIDQIRGRFGSDIADDIESMRGNGVQFFSDDSGRSFKIVKIDNTYRLYRDIALENISESTETNIPDSVRYTMPKTVILPDMDLYYEYYNFVKAMACHPELDPSTSTMRNMRDVPIAVAYTPQEYDMIQAVAKRMGKKTQEIAFNGSQEPPGGNVNSPVMKFNMFESDAENMRATMEKLK